MRIFKYIHIVTALFLSVGLLLGKAHAFDASKVINGETSSTKVFEFFFTFKKDGKKKEAFEVLHYAAEQGNPAAQWKLARIYQTGDGVKQDSLRAFKMFQQIAEKYPNARPNTPSWQFSADALVTLGNYYRKGIEGTVVKPDPTKARVMYTTAAMIFRHPRAQFELGKMQINSPANLGQPRLGIRNLHLAYDKGHVGAEALLGYSMFTGDHVKQDQVRGLYMLANAKNRASDHDLEWITPLYDEAFALAKPADRIAATQKLATLNAQ